MPRPYDLRVVATQATGYALRWDDPHPAREYRVELVVRAASGAVSHPFELASGIPGHERYLDIQRSIPGLAPLECYDLEFRVIPMDGSASGTVTSLALPACTNAGSSISSFPTVAQEPPEPLGVFVVRSSATQGYEVRWEDEQVERPERYRVDMRLQHVNGFDAGYVELGDLAGDETWLDIQPRLPGAEPSMCYNATFRVTRINEGRDDGFGERTHQVCIGNDGNISGFPTVTQTGFGPPPAPPADVRVVRHGDGWQIEWRDISDDEDLFDPGVLLSDANGNSGGGIELPPQRANSTMIELPSRVTTFPQPAPGCYRAWILVFAVAADGATSLPGNTYAQACIDDRMLVTFGALPETGDGGARGRGAPFGAAVVGLAIVGVVFVCGGWGVRRVVMHGDESVR